MMKHLYECDYCDKRSKAYASIRDLKQHTRRWTHEITAHRTGEMLETHKCDECTMWENRITQERMARR